jgi:hypothetical protein
MNDLLISFFLSQRHGLASAGRRRRALLFAAKKKQKPPAENFSFEASDMAGTV